MRERVQPQRSARLNVNSGGTQNSAIRISGRHSLLKASTGDALAHMRRCKMRHSMDTHPAPQRKGLLTPEAFASFLFWLSPDHAHAARKYLDLRHEIVKLFIRKGCTHADELADRTLDRVGTI